MGGAQSKKRAEEEREAASAKRREIREKELKEARLAVRQKDFWNFEDISNLISRTEEKREEAAALEREIRKLEFEHVRQEDLWSHEPGPRPHLYRRIEEKREAASALRREIRMSMEERLVFIEWNLWSHEPGPVSSSSSTFPFTMGGVEEDEWTVRESEYYPALEPEIMEKEFLEEHFALRQQDLLVGVRTSNISSSERRFGSSAEEEEADSPASSCESMKSNSKECPMSF